MRILGIDPGSHRVGYGVLDCQPGACVEVVSFGTLEVAAGSSPAQCLYTIHKDMHELLRIFQPETVAIELLFFFRNLTTVISVAQARGVILLAISEYQLEFSEYTPMQVKQGLTGYGKASKKQVQQSVAQWLNLEQIPRPDDAADALALALFHAHQLGF